MLLDYGLRKGALRGVQFKHFDHNRKKLTVFTKGGKIRDLPSPHASFWTDLGRLIIEREAEPHHYLLCRCKAVFHGHRPDGSTRMDETLFAITRWASTACTTGGTDASSGPGSSRMA